jgi:hypothetical protein
MTLWFRCLISLLSLSGCATAPPGSNQARAPTNFTYDRVVLSDKRYRLDFFTTLYPDCTSMGYPAIRQVTAPAHGTLTVQEGSDYPGYSKDNQRFACNLKKSPGILTYYQSQPGFAGNDKITIEVIFPSATARMVTYNLVVK